MITVFFEDGTSRIFTERGIQIVVEQGFVCLRDALNTGQYLNVFRNDTVRSAEVTEIHGGEIENKPVSKKSVKKFWSNAPEPVESVWSNGITVTAAPSYIQPVEFDQPEQPSQINAA